MQAIATVAQLDRAALFRRAGRRFESCRWRTFKEAGPAVLSHSRTPPTDPGGWPRSLWQGKYSTRPVPSIPGSRPPCNASSVWNTTRYGRDPKGNQKFKCVACKRVTSTARRASSGA